MRDRESPKIPFALLLLFAVLGLTLGFSPHPVIAQAGCGITITTSTTLDVSLGPCPNDGLIIAANGITLNCAGYIVSGENNAVAGIVLGGMTGVTIKNCDVTGFQYGFYLSDSSSNTFTGNTANQNSVYGFYLGDSSSNTLTGNTASSNELVGFYFSDSSSNTFTGNTANSNQLWGFYLTGSSSNILTGNTANSDGLGFYLNGSSSNTLTGNTANHDLVYGYFDDTTGSGTAGTANLYTMDICDSNGVGGSSPRGLCAPVIAGAITPSAPTIDSGQSITLTANPYGGITPYSYQWYTSSDCNTSPISGATSSTYSASPASTTTYYYNVTSGSPPGSVCSPGDTVTVNPALAAGAITPSAPAIDSGQSVTLTAYPSGGTTPYTYRWYSGSSATCSSDTALLGTATTQSVSPASSTYYCYVLKDASTGTPAASATSASDLVTVNAVLATPTVSPSSPTIDSGQSITLTVSWFGGTPPYAVVLYSSSTGSCSSGSTLVSTNSAVSGTSTTFSVSPTTSTYYCVTATDSASSPVTTPAFTDLVTVDSALSAGAITPSAPAIKSGQSVTLTANPSGGTTPYSYQWYTGASCTAAISGATSATYLASPTATTTYYYKVTDGANTPSTACSTGDAVTVSSTTSTTATQPTTTTTTTTTTATATRTIASGSTTQTETQTQTTIQSTTVTQPTTTIQSTTQTKTQTQTTTQSATVTLPTTIIQTQSLTIVQTTTQNETTTQSTTTTTTTTTTRVSSSTTSALTYAALGAGVVVLLALALLAVWFLRGRNKGYVEEPIQERD